MLISGSWARILRILHQCDMRIDPLPCVLLEKMRAGDAVGAAQQRQRSADDMRRDVSPDLGVVVGEALLGDACVRPVDAVRMGQLDRPLLTASAGWSPCSRSHARCPGPACPRAGRGTRHGADGRRRSRRGIRPPPPVRVARSGPGAPLPRSACSAKGLDRTCIRLSFSNRSAATAAVKPVPTRPTCRSSLPS